MNITDNNTSYLINLDNIDVNYITNLNFQYDGASCPLWSANSSKNWGHDEFFEFKIMAEKKNDSTSSVISDCDDTIGYPTYRCVICDSDIPMTYRKEHNSSAKHKTCVKIAEAVLQRIQGHLFMEDNNEIVKSSSHTYFCAPCTVIVKNTDKIQHEASNRHQKAVLHDLYLNDLLYIYLDKNYLDTVDMRYLESNHDGIKDNCPNNDHIKDNKASVTNNKPLYFYNDQDCDTKAIMKKIEIHGQIFDRSGDTKAAIKKKSTCGPIETVNYSDTNDLSPDDYDNTMSVNQMLKKQRRKRNRKKRLDFKNNTLVEDESPINAPNKLMEVQSSIFQTLKAQTQRYSFQLPKPSITEQMNSIYNKNKVVDKHNHSVNNKVNPFDEPNHLVDHNESVDEQYHSIDDSNNMVDGKQGSIDGHSDSIDDQSNTVDCKQMSIDKQYHSIDDPDKTVDDIDVSIDDKNNVIDEQYHSFDDLSNTIDDKQVSIDDQNNSDGDSSDETDEKQVSNDDQNNSNDDSSNETDEKQCPIDDKNKSIVNQSNETAKHNNSVVDYIMLLNSNEFVDVKTEKKRENILSESDLEKYIEIITSLRYEMRPIHRLKLLNKDFIEIQTLDQCIVTVRADYFNGFHSREGRLQCRVCMVMVDEEPADHIYNIDHIANVRVPLEDMHCFRKINDSFKHCVHCNDTFCNFDLHKLLESHLTALKEAMGRSIPAKPIEPKKVGRTYCEPCNIYVDSHNFNSHTNGKPHKNNLSLFFTKETKKTLENITSTSSDKTYCDQCKMYVANFTAHKKQHVKTESVVGDAKTLKPNDVEKIYCEPCKLKIRKEMFPCHLYGKNHRTSLALVNESKGSQKVNFCTTCNLCVEKLSVHLSGEYHKFHAKKTNATKTNDFDLPTPSTSVSETNWNYQIKVTGNKTVCRICNVKVTMNAKNVTEHTSGQVHKINYNELLDKNQFKVVDNKFFCKLCKITVELTQELQHFETKTHKSALSQLSTDKTYCDKCNVYVKTANWSSHLSGEFHVNKTNDSVKNNAEASTLLNATSKINNYQIKMTVNETICRVCNVKVPSKTDNITEHVNGRAHKTSYNGLLDKNKIKISNNKLFCEPCKTAVDQTKELDHIETKTHKSALEQFDKDSKLQTSTQKNPPSTLYHCECCEIDILNTSASIKEHKDALGHKISEAFYKVARGFIDNSLHYHFERVENSIDSVTCRLCNITLSVEHSKKHLESPTHNFKYRSTLNENKVQKVNNKYFCQICSVDVLDREELKHIRSLTHSFEKQVAISTTSQSSLTSKSTGYRCAVCDVDVPNNPKNITIHEQGSSHVAKLKNLSFDDEEKVLMTRAANGREMICSLCKVTVPISGIREHVRGARHKSNKVDATTKSNTT